MKKLFKGAVIITANENFDIYYNGMLGIKGNEITYVGKYSSAFEKEFNADAIIYAANKVLMPGLINMHTHLPMTLFRGCIGVSKPGHQLDKKLLSAESKMTQDDVKIGAQIAVSEMILSGTTMCLDMYKNARDIADVIYDRGIRGTVSYSYEGSDNVGDTIRLTEYCTSLGDGRLKTIASLGLNWDGSDDEEKIKLYIRDAVKNNKKIHIHAADSMEQRRSCICATGLSPIKYLKSLGLFDTGVIAVHCVGVDDEDMDILKKNSASVVYCPTSDAKASSGFAPVAQMIAKGINVCIGTDSGTSSNNMDMLEEMHIGSIIAKGASGNPAVMNAEETIKMATINGARALGIDHAVGSLETGKKADVIMFNQSSPFFLPKNELCNNIVYSASRNELEMTMVDGKILMERGQLLKYNYEKLAGRFEESVSRLIAK